MITLSHSFPENLITKDKIEHILSKRLIKNIKQKTDGFNEGFVELEFEVDLPLTYANSIFSIGAIVSAIIYSE